MYVKGSVKSTCPYSTAFNSFFGSRTKWQRAKWYGQNDMDKMVGLYGQNGIGQNGSGLNGTDKMAWIKYY